MYWALLFLSGFPGCSDSKESACSAGNLGSVPGLGRSPEGGHGNPLQYACLENPHGQKSLAGLQSMGSELDRTEWLSTQFIPFEVTGFQTLLQLAVT